jgi:dTDP-4-amino-4,6-dideoxygalactose transaminase
MIPRIPIISSSVTCADLLYAFMHAYDKSISGKFASALSEFTQSRYIYLTNSGISAFYIILEVLKEKSYRKEVVLPAYTAGSLVVAVLKAGLKPVLCDISLEDFNLDRHYLAKVISSDTLAVVLVHAFGIGITNIGQLRDRVPYEVFFIEDCAQSMGSEIRGKQTGSFTEIGFFSFNRGKNLPTCGGGCIITTDEKIAGTIAKNISRLKEEGIFFKVAVPLQSLIFHLATNPYIYGLTYKFASYFKETAPPKDIVIQKNNHFRAALGLRLMKKREALFSQRYKNGMFLINALKDLKEIILPKILNDSRPVFNRLPVIFKDLRRRQEVKKRLWRQGIETSDMYSQPLHRMFNLGYGKEEFPNANYFTEHLLVLPVHPGVKQEDLMKMIKVIRER